MQRSPTSSHYHAIVVAHTHWDREWWATFEQFRLRLVGLIDGVIELLEHDPRFRYFTLDGQTIVLEDYLAIRPESESRLRALVQSGRLLIGPWYVLPDEFLVSAEALVRNLILGRQVGQSLGPVMPVGYVPDPFGHVAQLPQVLAGFGIDSFIFSRGVGDEGEVLGSEFAWHAPDGSNVLAIHQIGWDDRATGYLNAASLGYASPWSPRHGKPDVRLAADQLHELTVLLRRHARTPYLLINNGCDHMEAQPELPSLLQHANSTRRDVVYAQGTFQQFVEQVRSAAPEFASWEGELRGSRYTPILAGVLSTRMHLKQNNREIETLLERWAEPFGALAWLEGADYPGAFLWHAWRLLLQTHPHDSICGCGVDQVHEEMLPRFAAARQVGEDLVARALDRLTRDADRSWLPAGALPLAVFNALAWPRHDVVALTLEWPGDWPSGAGLVALSPDGSRAPCQITARRRCQPLQSSPAREVELVTAAFVARDLPATGFRVYGLLPEPAPDVKAATGMHAIENECYRVQARPDGTLDVLHKPSGHLISGALALVDQADAGDEYTFSPLPDDAPLTSRGTRPDVVVSLGSARSTIELRYAWALPKALSPDRDSRGPDRVLCRAIVSVALCSGLDRVDVEIDFDNVAQDHRLRLLLPTSLVASEVLAAGHYATLSRPMALPEGEGWAEQPSAATHHDGFVAVYDGRLTVALLAGDLPDYEPIPAADGTVTLALTLLRCVGWLSRDDIASRPGHAGPGLPAPGAQCPGQHRFRLALAVFEGQVSAGSIHRVALDHQVAARCVLLDTQAPVARSGATPERSFVRLEGEGLVMSAIKRSEDGHWLVLRVFNATRASSRGRLLFARSIKGAVALRLDETQLGRLRPNGHVLSFTAPPAKVLTFGVELRQQQQAQDD